MIALTNIQLEQSPLFRYIFDYENVYEEFVAKTAHQVMKGRDKGYKYDKYRNYNAWYKVAKAVTDDYFKRFGIMYTDIGTLANELNQYFEEIYEYNLKTEG